MRKYLLPLFALAMSVLAVSCQRTRVDLSGIQTGQEFFPLEVGKYITYNVDSTYYDDFKKVTDFAQVQMRYENVDSFRDAEGRLSYRINVLWRKKDGDPYALNFVIYATRTSTGLEYIEKNTRFLKLIFPVEEGKSWNGNTFIPFEDPKNEQYNNSKWNYVYAKKGASFDPGNNLYETTVTVNEIDDKVNDPDVDSTAYAYRNYSQEIYAFKVGLVYRERIYWTFQPSMGSQGGGSGYRKGYAVTMRAIDNN